MRCVAGLFCGGRPGQLSLGRVTFWLTLVPALALWCLSREIADLHFKFLIIMAAYNFGSKFISTLKDMVAIVKGVLPNGFYNGDTGKPKK